MKHERYAISQNAQIKLFFGIVLQSKRISFHIQINNNLKIYTIKNQNSKFPYSSKSGHKDAVVLEIGGDLPEVLILFRLLVLEETDEVSLLGLKHEMESCYRERVIYSPEKVQDLGFSFVDSRLNVVLCLLYIKTCTFCFKYGFLRYIMPSMYCVCFCGYVTQ